MTLWQKMSGLGEDRPPEFLTRILHLTIDKRDLIK